MGLFVADTCRTCSYDIRGPQIWKVAQWEGRIWCLVARLRYRSRPTSSSSALLPSTRSSTLLVAFGIWTPKIGGRLSGSRLSHRLELRIAEKSERWGWGLGFQVRMMDFQKRRVQLLLFIAGLITLSMTGSPWFDLSTSRFSSGIVP